MELTTDELIRLTSAAYEIACEAGIIILKKRNESLRISAKKDGSPATAGDTASEAHIVAALKKLTPDIPIIAEEDAAKGTELATGSGPFWLIDPLDGTKDYIAGDSEFCINIALVVGDAPILGVIHAPAYEESFMGIVGHGATRVRNERAEETSARFPPAAGLTVLSSRRHGNEPELEKYLAGVKISHHKRLSSALKLGLLAAGEGDIYPRFGRVMGWDVAAGHAILIAAGGRISTANGQPLNYRHPEFEIPNFVARGRLNG